MRNTWAHSGRRAGRGGVWLGPGLLESEGDHSAKHVAGGDSLEVQASYCLQDRPVQGRVERMRC